MSRSFVGLWLVVLLAVPSPGRAGGPKPQHAPAPHFQPPKMPHYQPPQMQMPHFQPPKMPQQKFPAAPRVQQQQQHLPRPQAMKVKTPTNPQNQYQPGAQANGFNTAQSHTTVQHSARTAHSTSHAPQQNELLQSILPPALAATGTLGVVGAGSRAGWGAHHGGGYGSYHGYRGPYRYRPRNNYVGMLPQQRARLQHLRKLVIDLDNLGPGTVVTQTHRNALRGDLMALVQGPYRPDQASVTTLASDLAGTLPQRKHRPLDTLELAGDLEVVVNGRHLPPEGLSTAIGDAEAVLLVSGVPRSGVKSLSSSMRVVGSAGLGLGAPFANNAVGIR
jgi:hypothetical protein